MHRYLPMITGLLIVFSCTSCAFVMNHLIPSGSKDTHAINSISDEGSPLSLQLLSEVNDGGRLYVKGSVKAVTDWQVESVLLRLASLKGQEVIGEAYYPLESAFGEMPSKVLRKGEDIPFSMSVSAAGMTDYQIELLWGEEADSYKERAKSASNKAPSVVRLENLLIERGQASCTDQGCERNLVINASLVNEGQKELMAVILGVRAMSGADEENLEVTDLKIQPGLARPLRIEFKVPQGYSEDLKPSVRLLKYRFISDAK